MKFTVLPDLPIILILASFAVATSRCFDKSSNDAGMKSRILRSARHLLWIFSITNLMALLVPYPRPLLCFSAGVLICVAVACFAAWGNDAPSANLRLILASVFAAPLCILFLWTLAGMVYSWLAPRVPVPPKLLQNLFFPALMAYYIVPSYIGIAYVIVAVFFLWFAIFRGAPRRARWMIGLYIAAIACIVAYILWWHFTGQKWTFT